MPHSVTKWVNFKYWAAIIITFPPILMFKCHPWSKMCALAAPLIFLVTSCTYLEIWFDSGLHVPNDPCLTDSPWLLSCSSFSKRQESPNSWVSHESRLSTPVMQHWDCKPAPVWCLAVWVETCFHCKQLRFCLASSLVVSLAVCGPGHTLQNS